MVQLLALLLHSEMVPGLTSQTARELSAWSLHILPVSALSASSHGPETSMLDELVTLNKLDV